MLTPSLLDAPSVTRINTHQAETDINDTENHGTKLFAIPISYDANQTLQQTLVPPLRDQPKDQQTSRD